MGLRHWYKKIFPQSERKRPLFYWKPLAKHYKFDTNFGDDLSELICEKIVGHPLAVTHSTIFGPKLLAVGSLLHFAEYGDTIWGSGMLGPQTIIAKVPKLDIRAVRGPLTRDYIHNHSTNRVPEIYGDPALLFPILYPEFVRKPTSGTIGLIYHFRDEIHMPDPVPSRFKLISVKRPPKDVIRDILECTFVISSSLHGLIIADAFSIPCRWLHFSAWAEFKFYDYYLGTNRSPRPARSVSEAEDLGGEALCKFDYQKLLDAFPKDLPLKTAVART